MGIHTVADPLRTRLAHLIERQREDAAGLSRMLGRSPGYVARYLREGRPARLTDRDRKMLAKYFSVHPDDLTARNLREWRVEQRARLRTGQRKAGPRVGQRRLE